MPICGIVKDKQGDIWISTTKGIWYYDSANAQFIGHVSGNGLRSPECVMGAVVSWPDDKIAIGTTDGITVFYPNQVKTRMWRWERYISPISSWMARVLIS